MNTRLLQFLAAENISQAQFADTINVARASISHILSGRNKPSFDFIQSMGQKYPELNLEWLITGKGKMYKAASQVLQSPAPEITEEKQFTAENTLFGDEFSSTNDTNNTSQSPIIEPIKQNKTLKGKEASPAISTLSDTKKITKIVVFFDDNTFQEFGTI